MPPRDTLAGEGTKWIRFTMRENEIKEEGAPFELVLIPKGRINRKVSRRQQARLTKDNELIPSKVAALKESIRNKRPMHPLSAYQSTAGYYILLDGNHTDEAMVTSGWTELPVYVLDIDPADQEAIDRFQYLFGTTGGTSLTKEELIVRATHMVQAHGWTLERAALRGSLPESAVRDAVNGQKVQAILAQDSEMEFTPGLIEVLPALHPLITLDQEILISFAKVISKTGFARNRVTTEVTRIRRLKGLSQRIAYIAKMDTSPEVKQARIRSAAGSITKPTRGAMEILEEKLTILLNHIRKHRPDILRQNQIKDQECRSFALQVLQELNKLYRFGAKEVKYAKES